MTAVPVVSAAEASDAVVAVDDRAFFDPMPVVLSVSRLAQPLADAPGSVTVIDAAEIRASGARDLADLLRGVPGFQVAQSGGGAPIAVYHGMTDSNPRGLQILVDGRSQYSPLFFGGVSWNLIDVSLDDIDRIEVIRGSNSAAYGSNAFLGVVNVITRAAAGNPGTGIRLAQGSGGVADRYARLGVATDAGFFRLSAERQRDDGLPDVHDSRRNDRISLRGDFPLGASHELQIQAGLVGLALDAGDPKNTQLPPRLIEATRDYQSVGWLFHGSDGDEASLRYTRSRERYRDIFVATNARLNTIAAGVGLPSPYLVLIDQRIRTMRDELEFQHTLVPADRWRLVWGAGERHDHVVAPQFYGTDDTLEQKVHRLFGNIEWRPDAWVFNLGATRERDSLSGTSFAPRLSANYHLSGAQTLRAGVSRAHRIPTLTESLAQTEYGSFDTTLLGSPLGVIPVQVTRRASGNLKPERIDAQEIGYLGDFRESGVLADVRLFNERVQNRIVPVELALRPPDCEMLGLSSLPANCGKATDYLNGQTLDIRGLEYQIRWKPRRTTEITFNQTHVAIDAHANADFVARDRAAAEAADRHMEHSAPKLATMLRWREQLPFGYEGSIAHYRYSRFQWTVDSSVGPFTRTDLRLARRFRLGQSDSELVLVVQGAGKRHAEYRDRAVGAGSDSPVLFHARTWLGLTLGL